MVLLRVQDPNKEYMIVRVSGGEQPGPTFSQKAGQMKLNGKAIAEDIKKLTVKEFKLQKVHVEVAAQNRQVELRMAPTTAQLIIRELKEKRLPKKKGAEKVDQTHEGSLSWKSVLTIVDEIHEDRSRSNSKKGTLKQILGTALSVGCTIEEHGPKEVLVALNANKTALATLLGLSASSLPEYLN
ncbi:Ribosomal protein L11 [Enterospora canceri]|uniref:Ribosomal protein L11 n=1 Tax=Enterospora canceri TaxID=1081671 RepID=A0A1Y1S9Q7_9MICR|nr:Ribosomal protein L11 [Enterospora canceri]